MKVSRWMSSGNFSALPHAVHEIAPRAGLFGLDEAVDVGVEARKLLVEGPRALEILDDREVESLTWDEPRNAGWVGRQQHARDATLEVVDLDALDLAVRHAREGV